jgi:hypothetical protein
MHHTLLYYATLVLLAQVAAAQQDQPFQWGHEKPDWRWEEDARFDELMEQLAINEASLDAVEKAIGKNDRQRSTRQKEAKRYDENNRMMDRKGGGPMNWMEFYGTNAEKFFYHPIDPNTTYHTLTALQQIGKVEDDKDSSDIPSRQSLPVHQRPPQWDYIYRANRMARQTALSDVDLLKDEVSQLKTRKTELEQEQAVLWCKLAFRAVRRQDLERKAVGRFSVVATDSSSESRERAIALNAASQFLATSLCIVEKAEDDLPVAMRGAKWVVVDAGSAFSDALLGLESMAAISHDRDTSLGKFFLLAKALEDKSKTMSESYAGAVDGSLNYEDARKNSFRRMLQKSVVDYAQILLSLGELVAVMEKAWDVRVETQLKKPHPEPKWVLVEQKGGQENSPRERRKNYPQRSQRRIDKINVNLTNEQALSENVTIVCGENSSTQIRGNGLRLACTPPGNVTVSSKATFVQHCEIFVQYNVIESTNSSSAVTVSLCGQSVKVSGAREDGPHWLRAKRDKEWIYVATGHKPLQKIRIPDDQSDIAFPISFAISALSRSGGALEVICSQIRIEGVTED